MAKSSRSYEDKRDDNKRVPTMVFSLLGNGFFVDTVRTGPGYTLMECRRPDEFSVITQYSFVLPSTELSDASARAIGRYARGRGAHMVVVAEKTPEGVPGMDWSAFQARLGGPIKSWLPLEASFPEMLSTLGHNQPVDGVEGRPDDLFEEYVNVALQFILGSRILRYGQKRSGEARPDGAALGDVVFLYDAKAYAQGYPVELDSIRQFCSYVQDFNSRYEHWVGRIHSFMLVSGHFRDSSKALEDKADQMYSECGVRLTYLTADDLGSITKLMSLRPILRRSVSWKHILSRTHVTVADVQKSLGAVIKDDVIRSG